MSGCPVRKLEPEPRISEPAVERVHDATGERWVIRSFAAARQILRDPVATRQAGFGADTVGRASTMRPPILYQEGQAHREQRRAAARLFAPKVTEGYREMIEALSARLLRPLDRGRRVDLSAVSMRMAVDVAAQVVGLTNSSRRGLSRRLDSFFSGDPMAALGSRNPRALLRLARSTTATTAFFALDVKPAIRARRRRPREDVISQLLGQGFSDPEILTECLTYGAAGMVTTREFITMGAWHLLDDPDLLVRYRAADTEDRVLLLQETLRLEPVVGHLQRRAEQPLTVPGTDGELTIEAGALIDLDVRAINADAETVGEQPYRLCPGRELPAAVPPALMSFGDGHHRCPGAPIAMMESEIFLSALFERPVSSAGPPRVSWNPITAGYDLDGFWVSR